MSHTPTPWTVEHDNQDDMTFISSVVEHLASVHRYIPEYEANAAYIVQAVNSHEAMKEALIKAQETLEWVDRKGWADCSEELEQIEKALTIANGGKP